MAYVDGGSLEDIIEDRETLTVRRIEKVLREIASALDYANRRGVIHRDVKPANILIDSEGHALLADFGIVKMMGNDKNLTGTGVVGTPAYIAPEQGQGEANIDGRADLYSLACVVYEMFSGVQPYRAETMMRVVLQHITEPIPSLIEIVPDLPPALDAVMHRAMAKNPNDRYATAVEFAEALTHALHNSEESLLAMQAEVPLDRTSPGQQVTQVLDPLLPADRTAPENQSNPTIIVQQTTNPLLFMGLFGIIALVIVVVAIVLVGQQNQNATFATNATEPPAVVENTSPTDVPVPEVVPNVETFGEMRYNTTESQGDTINLQLIDVDQPSGGNRYIAWLKNTSTGEVINIGEIVLEASGRGILIYTDAEQRMLPSLYNNIVITQEINADGELPEGDIAYVGEVPIELTQALYEIFVSSADGFNGDGLLAGIGAEGSTAQNHAGLAAGARNIGSMKTHAEHTLNIINGSSEDYDGNGSPQNPGRGVGMFFFLDKINGLLLDVVQRDDVSIYVQQNAEFIFVCTTNISDWANGVNELELKLIAAESLESVAEQAAESEQLALAMTAGIDVNDNGRIDAFEGECGLDQIPAFGIQVGNIDIVAVK
jgi:Protein kinase domain